jgi:platelet-activating factor acetylhydrolase
MLFSHGLGGSRNAYSHICGSLASHGIVVVAPDHRDGSAPISFIHGSGSAKPIKSVDYKRIDHKPSSDVYAARDEQLRVRLSEMGLIHSALLKIDTRQRLTNVAGDAKTSAGKDMLTMFAHLLAIHEPGSISFAGHSFGAATTLQLVKSVFYNNTSGAPASYKPLFTTRLDSALKAQITPTSPVLLLDLWTLPIQSPATAWLRSQSMPSYASSNGKGGSNILSILSEGFFKWSTNMNETVRLLAPPKQTGQQQRQQGANIFYPIHSAHLSQSDFGILFPWATMKFFGVKEPERVLRLNTRAALQVLRNSGVEVANTSIADLELGEGKEGVVNDEAILSTQTDSVRGWICVKDDAAAIGDAKGSESKVGTGPGEAVMQGEAFGQGVGGK